MNEMKKAMTDLDLTYEQAAHGIQSVKMTELNGGGGHAEKSKFEPKHIRTGIDLSKAEQMGLASLLIDKGVFTREEYSEYMRLAANTELAREEEKYGATFR